MPLTVYKSALTQIHCLSVFRQRNTALFIVNHRRSGRPTSSASPSWKIRIEANKVNQKKTSRKAQTGADCRGIPPRYFRASSHCALFPGSGIMGRQITKKVIRNFCIRGVFVITSTK